MPETWQADPRAQQDANDNARDWIINEANSTASRAAQAAAGGESVDAFDQTWDSVRDRLQQEHPHAQINPLHAEEAYRQVRDNAFRQGLLSERQADQSQYDNARYWTARLPFTGHITEFAANTQDREALQRVRDGGATQDDYLRLGQSLAYQQTMAGRTGSLQRATDVGTSIPGFGVEMYVAAPVGLAARGLTAGALAGYTGRIAQAAQAILPRAAQGFAMTAPMAASVTQGVSERLIPEVSWNENGTINVGPDRSVAMATWQAYLDTQTEIFTELAGGKLVQGTGRMASMIPGSARAQAATAGLARWWTRTTGQPGRMFNAALRTSGWNGIFGEFLEERFGEVARAGLAQVAGGDQADGGMTGAAISGRYQEALDQLVVEGLAFGAYGAATGIAGRMARRAMQGGMPRGGPRIQAPPEMGEFMRGFHGANADVVQQQEHGRVMEQNAAEFVRWTQEAPPEELEAWSGIYPGVGEIAQARRQGQPGPVMDVASRNVQQAAQEGFGEQPKDARVPQNVPQNVQTAPVAEAPRTAQDASGAENVSQATQQAPEAAANAPAPPASDVGAAAKEGRAFFRSKGGERLPIQEVLPDGTLRVGRPGGTIYNISPKGNESRIEVVPPSGRLATEKFTSGVNEALPGVPGYGAVEVPVKEDPWRNVSSWIKDNLKPLADMAEKNGVADKIEELSAQRLTAGQIADKLGIERDMVQAVRIARGIPSMNAGGPMGGAMAGSKESQEFTDWVNQRAAKKVERRKGDRSFTIGENRALTGKEQGLDPAQKHAITKWAQFGKEVVRVDINDPSGKSFGYADLVEDGDTVHVEWMGRHGAAGGEGRGKWEMGPKEILKLLRMFAEKTDFKRVTYIPSGGRNQAGERTAIDLDRFRKQSEVVDEQERKTREDGRRAGLSDEAVQRLVGETEAGAAEVVRDHGGDAGPADQTAQTSEGRGSEQAAEVELQALPDIPSWAMKAWQKFNEEAKGESVQTATERVQEAGSWLGLSPEEIRRRAEDLIQRGKEAGVRAADQANSGQEVSDADERTPVLTGGIPTNLFKKLVQHYRDNNKFAAKELMEILDSIYQVDPDVIDIADLSHEIEKNLQFTKGPKIRYDVPALRGKDLSLVTAAVQRIKEGQAFNLKAETAKLLKSKYLNARNGDVLAKREAKNLKDRMMNPLYLPDGRHVGREIVNAIRGQLDLPPLQGGNDSENGRERKRLIREEIIHYVNTVLGATPEDAQAARATFEAAGLSQGFRDGVRSAIERARSEAQGFGDEAEEPASAGPAYELMQSSWVKWVQGELFDQGQKVPKSRRPKPAPEAKQQQSGMARQRETVEPGQSLFEGAEPIAPTRQAQMKKGPRPGTAAAMFPESGGNPHLQNFRKIRAFEMNTGTPWIKRFMPALVSVSGANISPEQLFNVLKDKATRETEVHEPDRSYGVAWSTVEEALQKFGEQRPEGSMTLEQFQRFIAKVPSIQSMLTGQARRAAMWGDVPVEAINAMEAHEAGQEPAMLKSQPRRTVNDLIDMTRKAWDEDPTHAQIYRMRLLAEKLFPDNFEAVEEFIDEMILEGLSTEDIVARLEEGRGGEEVLAHRKNGIITIEGIRPLAALITRNKKGIDDVTELIQNLNKARPAVARRFGMEQGRKLWNFLKDHVWHIKAAPNATDAVENLMLQFLRGQAPRAEWLANRKGQAGPTTTEAAAPIAQNPTEHSIIQTALKLFGTQRSVGHEKWLAKFAGATALYHNRIFFIGSEHVGNAMISLEEMFHDTDNVLGLTFGKRVKKGEGPGTRYVFEGMPADVFEGFKKAFAATGREDVASSNGWVKAAEGAWALMADFLEGKPIQADMQMQKAWEWLKADLAGTPQGRKAWDNWLRVKALIAELNSQTGVQRVDGLIAAPGNKDENHLNPAEKVRSWWDRAWQYFLDAVWNELNMQEKAEARLTTKPKKGHALSEIIPAQRYIPESMANLFYFNGIHLLDPKTDQLVKISRPIEEAIFKSLGEYEERARRPVRPGGVMELEAFAVAEHILDEMARYRQGAVRLNEEGQKIEGPPFTNEWQDHARRAMSEFAADPGYLEALRRASAGYREINDAILEAMAALGRLSGTAKQRFKQAHPVFVSMQRMVESYPEHIFSRAESLPNSLMSRSGANTWQVISPIRTLLARVSVLSAMQTKQVEDDARRNQYDAGLPGENWAHPGEKGQADLMHRIPAPAEGKVHKPSITQTTRVLTQVLGDKNLAEDMAKEFGDDLAFFFSMPISVTGEPLWVHRGHFREDELQAKAKDLRKRMSEDEVQEKLAQMRQEVKESWFKIPNSSIYNQMSGAWMNYDPGPFAQAFLKFAKMGSDVTRIAGTGINIPFQVKSLITNPFSFIQNTEKLSSVAELPKAMYDAVRYSVVAALKGHSKAAHNEIEQLFFMMGGEQYRKIAFNQKGIDKQYRELQNSKTLRDQFGVVKDIGEAVINVLGASELGGKMLEFKTSLEDQGWPLERIQAEWKKNPDAIPVPYHILLHAAFQSNEIEPHDRAGWAVRRAAPYTAFMMSHVSGLNKYARQAKGNPPRMAIAAAIFAAVEILHALMYKDEPWYDEQEAYLRYRYWAFPLMGKLWRIPKPQGFMNAPNAVFQEAVRTLLNKDPRINEALWHVLTEAVPAPVPSVVQPGVDILWNQDFAGRPIVPRGEENAGNAWQYQAAYIANQALAGLPGTASRVAREVGQGQVPLNPFAVNSTPNASVDRLFATVQRMEAERLQARRGGRVYAQEGEYRRLSAAADRIRQISSRARQVPQDERGPYQQMQIEQARAVTR